MYTPSWVAGEWKAICDRCGRLKKSSQLKKTWDKLMVCEDSCWEPRHPQDFLRTPADQKPLPWTRPEPSDTFVSVTYAAPTVGVQDNTVPSSTGSHGDL